MLHFIGLGLYDERDISLKGLEAIRSADAVYVEFYTSRLMGTTRERMEALYGKRIHTLSREVEADPAWLEEAKDKDTPSIRVLPPSGPEAESDQVGDQDRSDPCQLHCHSRIRPLWTAELPLRPLGYHPFSLCPRADRLPNPYQVLMETRPAPAHPLPGHPDGARGEVYDCNEGQACSWSGGRAENGKNGKNGKNGRAQRQLQLESPALVLPMLLLRLTFSPPGGLRSRRAPACSAPSSRAALHGEGGPEDPGSPSGRSLSMKAINKPGALVRPCGREHAAGLLFERGFMSRITAILCRHEMLYRRGNVRRAGNPYEAGLPASSMPPTACLATRENVPACGHTYQVEMVVEGGGADGLVMDFYELKKILSSAIEPWTTSVERYPSQSTAEMIAQWIAERLKGDGAYIDLALLPKLWGKE